MLILNALSTGKSNCECKNCQTAFTSTGTNHAFCSVKCRKEYYNRNRKKRVYVDKPGMISTYPKDATPFYDGER